MSPKAVPCIAMMHLDFEGLAQCDDRAIYEQMEVALKSSRKRILPKSMKYDRYRVTRELKTITIDLYMGDTKTGQFRFTAPESFLLE